MSDDNALAELEEAARLEGARRPSVVARIAAGEESGSVRDRVRAVRESTPELFAGVSELLRRATGRSTRPTSSAPTRSTSSGAAPNEAIRRGFGKATPAPAVDTDAPPAWGDAEGGARGDHTRGSRLNVGRSMNRAIRAARSKSRELDLEFDD
jgi:hypothetical protein